MKRLSADALYNLNDFVMMLYRLYGVHATVRLPGIPAGANPWDFGRPWLCGVIRSQPELKARCDASEERLCRKATRRPAPGTCHAGMEQWAIPIMGNGRSCGHVIVSPVRSTATDAHRLARVIRRSTGSLEQDGVELEKPKYAWFTRQIPVLDARERELMRILADGFFRSFFNARTDAGRARGYELYPVPVRAADDERSWLSYLWSSVLSADQIARRNARYDFRTHSTLLFAQHGTCEIEAGGTKLRLERGEIVHIPSGARFRVQARGEGLPFWIMYVSNVDLDRIRFKPFRPPGIVYSMLDRISRSSLADWRFNFGTAGRIKVLELLLELRKQSVQPLSWRGRPPHPGGYSAAERAREFIRENLSRPVSLAELARAAGTNPFVLCRRFRAAYGASPLAFHRDLRIYEAMVLLRDPNLAIKAVSRRLGFRNESSFARVFKSRKGVSPRAFRESMVPVRK